MIRLGLTGGIACGKTTVAQELARRHWQVIDTDELAREVVEPGTIGYEKVVDAFGPIVLDSQKRIDRRILGGIVFSSECKRILLNSILHPLIRARWQSRWHQLELENPRGLTVVVIPLLFEAGLASWFDSVACVGCSGQTQRARMAERGWDRETIEARLRVQWPLEQKIKQSQIVLWNDGSYSLLFAQIDSLVSEWRRRAERCCS